MVKLAGRYVEAVAMYHVAQELSRREWDVLIARERSPTKEYDLVATKPGHSWRIEVKGRTEGSWGYDRC